MRSPLNIISRLFKRKRAAAGIDQQQSRGPITQERIRHLIAEAEAEERAERAAIEQNGGPLMPPPERAYDPDAQWAAADGPELPSRRIGGGFGRTAEPRLRR